MTSTPPPLPGQEPPEDRPPAPPPLPGQDVAGSETSQPPAAAQVRVEVGPKDESFACAQCGAHLVYAPGTTHLRCPYCGHEQDIHSAGTIQEHDYVEWAQGPRVDVGTLGARVLACPRCGANVETEALALACPFCRTAMVQVDQPQGLIAPEALIPFTLGRPDAEKAVTGWTSSRWFAPNSLKQVSSAEGLHGLYAPHWTYDAATRTHYTGMRGEYYWVTETYTTTDDQGRPQTQTRQVQRTRWWPASGVVRVDFDDVLVPAGGGLGPDLLADLGPWTLGSAVPYTRAYLSGFEAARYSVDPDVGLEAAKTEMRGQIRRACERDIGGDVQQVASMDTGYQDVRFKLVLLPVWVASYVHAGKVWPVYVNANTGQVIGERPYSWVKIALAVIAALIVIGVVATIWYLNRSTGTGGAGGYGALGALLRTPGPVTAGPWWSSGGWAAGG